MEPQQPTLEPPTKINRLHVLRLAALLCICAALRVGLICKTDVIARDGTVYVSMSREWASDPLRVVREYDYHVGYVAVVSLVGRALIAAGRPDNLATWELAGQMVSLAASVAALAAIWLFARVCFNERIAWITVLLFGVGRKWATLGADVLSDSLAVCLQMWAVALAMVTLNQIRRRSRWAIALGACVGLCAGLGYLVRPESLLAGGLAGILWLGYQLRHRKGWPVTLAAVGANAAVAAACVAPYALAIGGLTKKKTLSEFVYQPAAGATGRLQASIFSPELLEAAKQFSGKLSEAMHPAITILACIWILAVIGKRVLRIKLLAPLTSPLAVAGAFMIFAAMAVMAPLLMGLYMNVQYLSHRHVMFLAALLSPLAGAGAVVLAGVAGKIVRLVWARMPDVDVLLLVGGLLIGLSLHALRPLHADKGYFRQAGEFLAGHADAGAFVLTDSSWILHYSQLKGEVVYAETVGGEKLKAKAEETGATHLVLSDRELRKAEADLNAVFTSTELAPVEEFIQEGSRKPDTVRIHELRLGPAPDADTDAGG